MLNFTLLEQRLALIAGYLTILETLSDTSEEDFITDKTKSGATESYLRRTLEAIFDIGRHILAKTGNLDIATEYKGIARGLKQKGIVGRKLGDQLIKMAGYRNRLVHLYNEVSDEELYAILMNDLADIRSFIKNIQVFITKNKPVE